MTLYNIVMVSLLSDKNEHTNNYLRMTLYNIVMVSLSNHEPLKRKPQCKN